MTSLPKVSVVIVSFNTRDLTLRALDSVFRQRNVDLEVWVVDNASQDGTVEAIRMAFPKARVLALDANVGFGGGNNRAMAMATGTFFLLLNSDAFLREPEDIRKMVEVLLRRPDIGVLGPRLQDEDGSLEYSARRFPSVKEELLRRFQLFRFAPRKRRASLFLLEFFAHDEPAEVDWVTGACMLVRKEAFDTAGGFDPEIFMYGEEREWCRRIRAAGMGVLFHPVVTVVHRRGGSSPERGRWRARRALKADLQFVGARGRRAYGWLFFWVRLLGLTVETGLYGALGFLRSSDRVRRRARAARQELEIWIRFIGKSNA